MYAKYRPGYSWFYLERQLPLEVCLFKNFDSRGGIRASMCPHVSFEQDNAPKHAKPRESIEVRAFVYTRPCTPA
ncbi:hypothetical protein BDW74DRAFT_162085 [Aspergillus multicolor]|uniref:uncharacterized protein n=1 Tax=Aspergillus multicolor TaxID=41759 RepID=UPI003CCD44D3